jgi:hypothetical protein
VVTVMRLAIEFAAENCKLSCWPLVDTRTQQRGYSRALQTPSQPLLGADHHRTAYTTSSDRPLWESVNLAVEHAF